MKHLSTFDVQGSVCVKLVVRWGECDAAGIAYYANYFDWFAVGRVEYLKQKGLPYLPTFHEKGISLVAIDAYCRYIRSVKPDDEISVETALTQLTRSRMVFSYRITDQSGRLYAEGYTSHAYVDPTGKAFDLKKRHPALWDRLSAILA